MPAIATSVEVVVAIACAISPIIGGRAFTWNGRRFVPSGRSGVGVAHWSLINIDHLLWYDISIVQTADYSGDRLCLF